MILDRFALPLLLVLALLAGCDRPADPGAPLAEEPALAGVDDRYRLLLRQEMVQVEGAMKRLLTHLARGEAELAANTASSIRDSFILRRNLSPDQIEELVSQLPTAFAARDERFHHTAGALAAAAGSGDLERAAALYGELVESCQGCHSRFARGRFPGYTDPLGPELEPEPGAAHHH